MARRPATIIDVAAIAGVSGKTVSRVVNREAKVSPETRRRVEAAIAQLNYSLNVSARALVTSRSSIVATVSRWMNSHYIGEIHHGGAGACRAKGLCMAVETLDPDDPKQLKRFLQTLGQVRFDGIILTPPLTDHPALLTLLDKQGVRYVRISPHSQSSRSDAISADNAAGMEMAVDHLWNLGHRRFAIAEFTAEKDEPTLQASATRRQGALDAIRRRGGDITKVKRAFVGAAEDIKAELTCPDQTSFELGYSAAGQLLKRGRKPTAILAYNDEMAAGIISYARGHGIDVPSDVSVVGFDNSVTAGLIDPGLTTIAQPATRMAELAVDWLTSSPVAPRHCILPVRLVVRGSTGPVRS